MKIVNPLYAALCAALLMLCGCDGGDSVSSGQRAPQSAAQVANVAQAEQAQDLIVVFDDHAIQSEASALQANKQVASSQRAVIELKATRFASRKAEVRSAINPGEMTVLKEYPNLPISFVRVHTAAALKQLRAHPGVLGVYENKVRHRASLTQSLALIGQPQAAAAGNVGAGTAVAVLDERVDISNAAFGSCTAPGAPASCKVPVAQDAPGLPNDGLGFQDGHGTNVAATVLAVAPGTTLISLNVFNGAGASDSDVINAINWCITNAQKYNIVAMNLSLGLGADSAPTTASPYFAAFSNARAVGILPIVAAGNDGNTSAISEPASVQGAVSVGAVYDGTYSAMSWHAGCTDHFPSVDQVACFSNSASFLTLLAPGCRDDAAMPSGQYFCGTSQAAPHVAGAVAVMRAAYPNDSLDQTVSRLTSGPTILDLRNGQFKPRLSLPAGLSLPQCTYKLTSTSLTVDAGGVADSSTSVLANSSCVWTAVSNASWITVLSGSQDSGLDSVHFSVAANNDTSPRSGTITIAGQTFTVTQNAGSSSGSVSSQSNIWLQGTFGYNVLGDGTITLNADQIQNTSATYTTGTLRLELWMSQDPYAPGVSAWRVATYRPTGTVNGTLAPNQSFYNVRGTTQLNLPPPGTYHVTMVVTQYDPNPNTCNDTDHFCLAAFGAFNRLYYVADVTPPSVPQGLTATAINATQVSLAWNASTDDVGVTAYKIYNGGVYLGSVGTTSTTISSLSASTTYNFTVSACDAAQNCSAQSNVASATTSSFSLDTGWWWNPAESGRGFAIEQRGGKIFMAGFLYDGNGQPTWFSASGPLTGKVFTAPITSYAGGQTMTGGYAAPTQLANTSGNVTLTFSDATHAVMTWPGGSTALQRFPIVSGGLTLPAPSFLPERGWWWNASEPGRGYAIEIQGNNMFIAGFMYDTNGRPIWYAANGTMTDSHTYQGKWVEFFGGQTLTGPYHPPSSTTQAFNVKLTFTDTQNATLYLPNETISITRFSNF